MKEFEVLVKQSFEEIITEYKKIYRKYCNDESVFEEKITRIGVVLRQTVSGLMPNKQLEVLANQTDSLLKEGKNNIESVNELMADFDETIHEEREQINRFFDRVFYRTYPRHCRQ